VTRVRVRVRVRVRARVCVFFNIFIDVQHVPLEVILHAPVVLLMHELHNMSSLNTIL